MRPDLKQLRYLMEVTNYGSLAVVDATPFIEIEPEQENCTEEVLEQLALIRFKLENLVTHNESFDYCAGHNDAICLALEMIDNVIKTNI